MAAPNPYPNLKSNPAVGTPDAVQGLVDALNRARTALDEARMATVTVANAQSAIWQGAAAEEFRKDIREKLPQRLDKAQQSFGRAATELSNWRNTLIAHQETARRLDADAAAARQKLGGAEQSAKNADTNPDLLLAGQQAATEADLANMQARYDSAVNALNQANADLKAAQAELKAVERRADELEDLHESDAKGVASRLGDADDIAPHKPKKSIWGSIRGAIKALEKAADWLSAAAGVVAIAALMVGMTTPIGLTLLIAGGLLSASALVGHLPAAIKNPGVDTILPAVLDVIGIAPGVKAVPALIKTFQGAAPSFTSIAPMGVAGMAHVIESVKAAKSGLAIPTGAIDETAESITKVLTYSGGAVGVSVPTLDVMGVEVDTALLDALTIGLAF
ncbi:MAG TPA: hypothetical protein VLH10_07630 [Yinghuangia sp.]|nr:hypothetical protein [Yinghuangia sp.]